MRPGRRLYVACYDIRSNRRRMAALKLMRGYATGWQKSVHEVFLTVGERQRLLDEVARLLDFEVDRFVLACPDAGLAVLTLGQAPPPAWPALFEVA